MEVLAREMNTSISSIYRAFEHYREYSPMTFLKEERMKNARKRLLSPRTDDKVANIALECGFAHIGRFSIDYRKKFGESPAQTLRRVL